MGVSKIGSLFAANVDALGNNSTTTRGEPQSTNVANQGPGNTGVTSDAVVFSKSIQDQRTADSGGDSSNRARLDEIRDRVSGGDYKVSSQDLAVALIRDLA